KIYDRVLSESEIEGLYEEGEGEVVNTTCTDSDGGLDYYVNGTVRPLIGLSEYADACGYAGTADDVLTEWYCYDSPTRGDGIAESELYTCPNGCVDGACVNDAVANQTESCSPLWMEEISPTVCPEYGYQIKKIYQNNCDSDDFPNREEQVPCSPGICSGCMDDDTCVPYGIRLDGNYCDIDGQIKQQRDNSLGEEWATCQNNYECASNICSYGECVDLRGLVRDARGIRAFFTKLGCRLGHLFNNENYNQCLFDNLGVNDSDPIGYFTFQIDTSKIAGTTFEFFADNSDLTIDWNDGNISEYNGTGKIGVGAKVSHTYVIDGIYNISVNGRASRISFADECIITGGYRSGTQAALIDILTKVSSGIVGINSSEMMMRCTINLHGPLTEPHFFDDISGDVTNMNHMFHEYNNFPNIQVSNWDTSSVIDMSGMFYKSNFNQDISSWDVSNVENMDFMFMFSDFNQDISSWDVSSVETMFQILRVSQMDVDNYDKLLIGWGNPSNFPGSVTHKIFDAAGLQYCLGKEARQNIMDDHDWVFLRDTENCSGVDIPGIPSLSGASYTTGDDIHSSPAIANGYLYVGSNDNKLYQLNASNVSQLIASHTMGVVHSSPAIANGYLYVGSSDDKLYQLNASNVSQLIASYTAGDSVHSSPAIANGYLYIGSNDNKLYQLNANNVSYTIL
ncbi:BspA family leucine-rich repeat surface protein, partial [archaeon]|nr:BspA family leucine-rich repeat surface protein [archaeon]